MSQGKSGPFFLTTDLKKHFPKEKEKRKEGRKTFSSLGSY